MVHQCVPSRLIEYRPIGYLKMHLMWLPRAGRRLFDLSLTLKLMHFVAASKDSFLPMHVRRPMGRRCRLAEHRRAVGTITVQRMARRAWGCMAASCRLIGSVCASVAAAGTAYSNKSISPSWGGEEYLNRQPRLDRHQFSTCRIAQCGDCIGNVATTVVQDDHQTESVQWQMGPDLLQRLQHLHGCLR